MYTASEQRKYLHERESTHVRDVQICPANEYIDYSLTCLMTSFNDRWFPNLDLDMALPLF